MRCRCAVLEVLDEASLATQFEEGFVPYYLPHSFMRNMARLPVRH